MGSEQPPTALNSPATAQQLFAFYTAHFIVVVPCQLCASSYPPGKNQQTSKCTRRTGWGNRLFQTGGPPASREQSLHTASPARAGQSSFTQGKSEAASRAAFGSRVNKGQSSLINHSHGASLRGAHACGAREAHSRGSPLPGAACEVAAHPAAVGDPNTPGSQLLRAHLSPLERPQTDANRTRIYHRKRSPHPTHLQAHSPCSGWYETRAVVTRRKQPTLVTQPQPRGWIQPRPANCQWALSTRPSPSALTYLLAKKATQGKRRSCVSTKTFCTKRFGLQLCCKGTRDKH